MSWRVHKETFVERWSGTRSDCSCITKVNDFTMLCLENDRFFFMLSKHSHAIARGVDTVSYAVTLALKDPPLKTSRFKKRVRMRVENNHFSTYFFFIYFFVLQNIN